MIAVDTNVLVRIVTNDDPKQAKKAADVFANNDIHIPKTVLLEAEWVLRSTYRLDRTAVAGAFRAVLGLGNVYAEDESRLLVAIEWFQKGMDFADALHLVSSGRAEQFVTFDRKLLRQAKNSDTVPVAVL